MELRVTFTPNDKIEPPKTVSFFGWHIRLFFRYMSSQRQAYDINDIAPSLAPKSGEEAMFRAIGILYSVYASNYISHDLSHLEKLYDKLVFLGCVPGDGSWGPREGVFEIEFVELAR